MTYDPHKSTNEVRGGDGRKANARVLILSLGAVILAFIVIYLLFFAFASPPGS